MSAVSGNVIPSGGFDSNSRVVRGRGCGRVRAHGFVLGAEHRHRHGGHQDRTLAVVQLSRTPGERSALEGGRRGEEEENEREERRGATPRTPRESSCLATLNTCSVLKSCSRHSLGLLQGASPSSFIHAHYLPLNAYSRSPPLISG